ncbi:MAG TPA: preprotein translocase subunit YajC [Actinomycetota bacterium]
MRAMPFLVAQSNGGGSSGVTFLISLVLLVAVFYFLLIRPQQRRMRAQRDLVTSLDVGDEVVTIGGMFGRVTEMDDESATLEISPGTRVRIVKQAIARRLNDMDELTEPEDEEPEGRP